MTAFTDLQANDSQSRLAALKSLATGSQPTHDPTIALLQATVDPYEPIRLVACELLENMEAPSAEMVSEIIACIQRPADSEVVYWAISLIGRAGPLAAEAVPAVSGVLANSSFPHVREKAAWALGMIGPAATGATAVLQDAAAKGTPRLKRLAISALESVRGLAA